MDLFLHCSLYGEPDRAHALAANEIVPLGQDGKCCVLNREAGTDKS